MSTPDEAWNTGAGPDIPLVQVTPHISPLEAVPFPTGNSQEDLIQTSPSERSLIIHGQMVEHYVRTNWNCAGGQLFSPGVVRPSVSGASGVVG
jgi:hypothetical protein